MQSLFEVLKALYTPDGKESSLMFAKDLANMPVEFNTSNATGLNILSVYISDGKIQVDVGKAGE